MIVLLPSRFTGGEVHLSHSGVTKALDFSDKSLMNTSVLGWYTDVEHQVKPVTAGYRFALSYNLVHVASGINPSLPDMNQGARNLRKVLRKWNKDRYPDLYNVKFLVYILEHKYSESELASAGQLALKGKDANKVEHLHFQTQELGYKLFFGSISCQITGDCEEIDDYGYGRPQGGSHEISEERERSYSLEHLVDTRGTSVLGKDEKLDLSEENIVQEGFFTGEEPDDEDYNYTGNVSSSSSYLF